VFDISSIVNFSSFFKIDFFSILLLMLALLVIEIYIYIYIYI